MYDLNDLVTNLGDWTIQDAWAINNAGQIVAFGSNSVTGEGHALLLTVVPEPSTYAFVLAAVSLGVVVVRRIRLRNQH